MQEIRTATSSDIPALVAVIQAAFAEYHQRLDPPSSAHSKSIASTQQELADGGAFVAISQQDIVGCVFYHPYADHMYLDRLAVLPSHRQQGFAGRLITAVEDHALKSGLSHVRLSVRLALAQNRAYYERLGYQFLQYGTHTGYLNPTYIVLQKVLRAA